MGCSGSQSKDSIARGGGARSTTSTPVESASRKRARNKLRSKRRSKKQLLLARYDYVRANHISDSESYDRRDERLTEQLYSYMSREESRHEARAIADVTSGEKRSLILLPARSALLKCRMHAHSPAHSAIDQIL